MGFPSPPASLSSPDYPEAVLDFNLSLSRAELTILQAQGEDGDAIRTLLADLTQAQKRMESDETPEEERTALAKRAETVDVELAAARAAARLQYGATLAKAYCHKAYSAYGEELDFRTAEAALATLANPALPEVFVTWLEYAPSVALAEAGGRTIKNFRTSLPSQAKTKKS